MNPVTPLVRWLLLSVIVMRPFIFVNEVFSLEGVTG